MAGPIGVGIVGASPEPGWVIDARSSGALMLMFPFGHTLDGMCPGTVFSAYYRGGMSAGTNFLREINGAEGDIVVTAAHGLGQMTDLTVRGSPGGEAPTALPTLAGTAAARNNPKYSRKEPVQDLSA